MLKNYLKLAIRNLRRHPGYTAINLLGFAVGIACCLFIVLYVQDELLFDRYHGQADRIYRVVEARNQGDENWHEASTSALMGPALVSDLPKVTDAARMWSGWRLTVKKGDTGIIVRNYSFSDPGLFRIFDFEVLGGDPAAALERPNGVVLTETIARQLFGDEDPVGKPLEIEAEDFPEFAEGGYEVGAVIRDLPHNTHLDFDMLMAVSTLYRFDFMVESLEAWRSSFMTTYVLTENVGDDEALNTRVGELNTRYRGEELASERQASLQPLSDIHFFSSHIWASNTRGPGNLTYVYLFAAIALVILLIACFNYMNMATARSVDRAREVGMRKVSGARRLQLIRQFLAESFLTAMLAMLIALGLVVLALPAFNGLVGKNLRLDWASNPGIWGGLFLITLGVGFMAGGYPALFLSRFKPAAVLKGTLKIGKSRLRQVLVVAQFVFSILMISATLVIHQQMAYTRARDLGFEPSQLVVIDINHDDVQENFPVVKTEFARDASVIDVAVSSRVPGDWKNFRQIEVRREGDDEGRSAYFNGIDDDFLQTYRISLAAGRNFDRQLASDSTALLLNETAARSWFPDGALGQPIDIPGYDFEGYVVGVVEDFHFHSLHNRIEPLVMGFMPLAGRHAVHGIDYFTLRIAGTDVQETLARLEAVHAQFDPINPMEYGFLDTWIHNKYAEDERQERVFGIGAGLAILIACVGLLGLAAFTAEQRTKEIGIRKLLGASVMGIAGLFTRDFLKLIFVAFVIAAPLAYFGMNRWLEDFAYQVDLAWWMFAGAGLIALLIAVITVGYQSVRAAMSNPVEALRYE